MICFCVDMQLFVINLSCRFSFFILFLLVFYSSYAEAPHRHVSVKVLVHLDMAVKREHLVPAMN
jgi:hypothetical protein